MKPSDVVTPGMFRETWILGNYKITIWRLSTKGGRYLKLINVYDEMGQRIRTDWRTELRLHRMIATAVTRRQPVLSTVRKHDASESRGPLPP